MSKFPLPNSTGLGMGAFKGSSERTGFIYNTVRTRAKATPGLVNIARIPKELFYKGNAAAETRRLLWIVNQI